MFYISEDIRKNIEDKCKRKDIEDLTWRDVANYVWSLTHGEINASPDYFRKHWDPSTQTWSIETKASRIVEYEDNDQQSLFEDEPEFSDNEQLRKIQIAKVKLSDERVQNNALIRRMAREDTIKEIAAEAVKEISKVCPLARVRELENDPFSTDILKEGILQISDWHYGICINSPFNQYNPEKAKERINGVFAEAYNLCNNYKLCNLRVVNLGDLIAGNIHLPIRLNSRIDVITQIIEISEILAEHLQYLSTIIHIDYYDTLDNHSRIDPIKANSIDLESLCRITNWYLKIRLKDNPNIDIHENEFGDDIVTFDILGHRVVAVHGHKDKPGTVVDSMSLMTKQYYDLALTAHFHHFSADEKNECLVISNGSLMGTDQYAQDLRLSAKPSQNFIVSTFDNVAYAIHRIVII